MKQYENMVLLDSTLEAQEAKELLGKITSIIDKSGGKVVRVENWGKRKCAYPVRKQTHAYYVVIWFEGGPGIVDELRRQYRIMERIVKYMIVIPTKPVDAQQEAEEAEKAAEGTPQAVEPVSEAPSGAEAPLADAAGVPAEPSAPSTDDSGQG